VGFSLAPGRSQTGLPNFPNRVRQQLRLERSGDACAGQMATFSATAVALDPPPGAGQVALAWNFGDPASGAANVASGAVAQHRFTQAGAYTVTLTATAASGPLVRQLDVLVGSQPGVRVQPRDTLVCEEQGVLLQASAQPAGTLFRWQDGSTGASLRATQAGLYWVEVRNAAGCVARDTVAVSTYACPILVPNLITPNGDNQNQSFVLKGLYAPDWSLRLYNRWGRQIFTQEKYDNRWSAENQPDGGYYYLLINARTGQKLKGWLEVRR
jgi:gliding motility-associated-like protein